MKCFYHTDLDGECSAAIVAQLYPECECIPISYNDDFPFERIQRSEAVYVVDFSLQKPGDWIRLLHITTHVTWIDHHKTAIEAADEECVIAIDGLRKDGIAGCVLTWQWLHSGALPPSIVSLIGDGDTWTFAYGNDTSYVHEYLQSVCDTRPTSSFWDGLLDYDSSQQALDGFKSVGALLLNKKTIRDAETVINSGWEVEFAGRRGVAVNRRCNSQLFASVADQFDLWLPCVFDGRQWTVSVYAQNGGAIDCSEIAKAHGGGGHKYAAGFQCEELPFTFVRRLKE